MKEINFVSMSFILNGLADKKAAILHFLYSKGARPIYISSTLFYILGTTDRRLFFKEMEFLHLTYDMVLSATGYNALSALEEIAFLLKNVNKHNLKNHTDLPADLPINLIMALIIAIKCEKYSSYTYT